MKKLQQRIVIAAALLLAGGLCADAQTGDGWKLKPEFTIRKNIQIYDEGTIATAGLRLNEKWTVGILAGMDEMYIDAAPGHIRSVETCAYQRFYIHLGKWDVISLYSDIAVGADWIYDVTGKYQNYYYDDKPGETFTGEIISENPGDVKFLAMWQPGIKIRIVKNIHIFAGPMVSATVDPGYGPAIKSLGLHLGLGF